MRRRLAFSLAAACGLALALPGVAAAHGLVGRQDLPIPRWLFAWGAAVVLVLSFVALAVLWPRPRLEGDQGGRDQADAGPHGTTTSPTADSPADRSDV